MNFKTSIFYLLLFIFVLFVSEVVNFVSNPTSLSSVALNTIFIKRSISDARSRKDDGFIKDLEIASAINIVGEYSQYRSRLPDNHIEKIELNDQYIMESFREYISHLTDLDLKTGEDQGLGKIYYNLALISYSNGYEELTPKLLNMAIYNNPEFASFHAELINYFFIKKDMKRLDESMSYCNLFDGSKTLCGQYKDDSLRHNIPREVGYMKDEVARHYANN